MNKYLVSAEEEGTRFDKYVCDKVNISRTLAKTLIEEGHALLNEKEGKCSSKVMTDDIVIIELPEVKEYTLIPENLSLDIVYEDEDLAVVNKPSGMAVHPAIGNLEGTLIHGLLYQLNSLSNINGENRPGIVHRIDKDTSGLLMVAKNNFAHQFLSEQLKEHTVTRRYVALVYGEIQTETGTINCPLGRDPKNRLCMAPDANGKEAITHFKVLERLIGFTFIECRLETGRTHQIRAHMKFIGHPIVGDPLYGPRKVIGEDGQFLHAQVLGFIHPTTREYLEFFSPLPEKFVQHLETLRA